MQLTDEDLRTIRGWAARHSCIEEVFLFGSRARGEARPDSDIDIAIRLDTSDARPPLGGRCFGLWVGVGHEWQQELISGLGRHVSLEALPIERDDHDWAWETIEREGVRLWPVSL